MSRNRLIVSFLLSMTVIFFSIRQLKEEKQRADLYFGLTFSRDTQAAVVELVDNDSPAFYSGLRPGDRFLSLNSSPVDTFEDLSAINYSKGQSLTLTYLREGVSMKTVIVPGRSFRYEPIVFLFLSILAHLIIALLALTRFGGDIRARLLFYLAAAVALELSLPMSLAPYGLPLEILYLLLNGLQMGLELHLASSIPHLQSWIMRRTWVIKLYYVFGGILSGAAILPLMCEDFGLSFFWSSYAGLSVYENFGHTTWALAVPLLLGYQAFNWPEAEGRRQAALVMLGGLPWSIFTFVTLLTPWFNSSDPWVMILSSAILLPYPIAISIAIFRYHLLDLHQVLRRSLIFTAITLTLVFSFYVFLIAGMVALSEKIGDEPNLWLVAAASLLIGSTFLPPEEQYPETHRQPFFSRTLCGEATAYRFSR